MARTDLRNQDERFTKPVEMMMMTSREACVNYMMPLGLHHIFKFDHHYGPEPDGFIASYPWNGVRSIITRLMLRV